MDCRTVEFDVNLIPVYRPHRYRTTVFGTLSAKSGGPWASHVHEPDGILVDAFYYCQSKREATGKARQAIRDLG